MAWGKAKKLYKIKRKLEIHANQNLFTVNMYIFTFWQQSCPPASNISNTKANFYLFGVAKGIMQARLHTYLHLGKFSIANSPPTMCFWEVEGKPENPEETSSPPHTEMGRIQLCCINTVIIYFFLFGHFIYSMNPFLPLFFSPPPDL